MTNNFHFVAPLILLAMIGVSFAQDADRKIDKEAFAGWERLRKKTGRSFVAKGSIRVDNPELKQPRAFSFIWKQNGDWLLCEIVDPTGIPGDRMQYKEVQATNGSYSFRALDKGTGWSINSMDQSAGRALPVQHFMKVTGLTYLESGWTVGGHPFPDVLNDPQFVFLDYAQIKEGAEAGLARLVFSIPSPPNPALAGKLGMDEAAVKFDTRQDWRIVEYHAKLRAGKQTGLLDGTVQYEPEGGFVRRVDQTATFQKNFKMVTTIKTDSVEYREVPEAEFSLSAYGLPEPADTPVKQPSVTPWYLWLLVAGAGLLLTAFLVRVMLQRRNAASQ